MELIRNCPDSGEALALHHCPFLLADGQHTRSKRNRAFHTIRADLRDDRTKPDIGCIRVNDEGSFRVRIRENSIGSDCLFDRIEGPLSRVRPGKLSIL